MNTNNPAPLTENQLSKIILDAAFKVHTKTARSGVTHDGNELAFFHTKVYLAEYFCPRNIDAETFGDVH